MIEYLRRGERDAFVELLGKHIQPAKNAYLEQSRHKSVTQATRVGFHRT
jgi:hypothetical protein